MASVLGKEALATSLPSLSGVSSQTALAPRSKRSQETASRASGGRETAAKIHLLILKL
jgi:hypothetical protein